MPRESLRPHNRWKSLKFGRSGHQCGILRNRRARSAQRARLKGWSLCWTLHPSSRPTIPAMYKPTKWKDLQEEFPDIVQKQHYKRLLNGVVSTNSFLANSLEDSIPSDAYDSGCQRRAWGTVRACYGYWDFYPHLYYICVFILSPITPSHLR